MAAPKAPTNAVNPGIIMADVWTTSITELYIYANGISRGEMLALVGHQDENGVLTDGGLTNALQALTAKSGDLDGATLEVDTETDSPQFGRLRINIPVV